jgi:hypothetical protein
MFHWLVLFCAIAHAAINEIPIVMGGPARRPNFAFVSVTVCEPGSSRCQTIPDIQLDSGSTGLRIFTSALKIRLHPTGHADGTQLAECKIFGGGESLWGAVGRADVRLGGELAKDVPIQLIDAKFRRIPANCRHPVQQQDQWSHGNGILGIGPARSDCGGKTCAPAHYLGARYYECAASGCQEFQLPLAEQVQNPITFLAKDNNGSIVRFPAGTLVLGIGTEANNQIAPGATVFASEEMGWIPVYLGGKKYWSKIDTGADFTSLPSGASGLPHCSGALSEFLCPAEPVKVAIKVAGVDETGSRDFALQILNADQTLKSAAGRLQIEGPATEYGGMISNTVILGLPFFYGRDVVLGIDGQSSPLGRGPFYALPN